MPRVCEGQGVPHSHKDDAFEYRYLHWKGGDSQTNYLCSRCVAYDRSRGYTLGRTFSEEEGPSVSPDPEVEVVVRVPVII